MSVCRSVAKRNTMVSSRESTRLCKRCPTLPGDLMHCTSRVKIARRKPRLDSSCPGRSDLQRRIRWRKRKPPRLHRSPAPSTTISMAKRPIRIFRNLTLGVERTQNAETQQQPCHHCEVSASDNVTLCRPISSWKACMFEMCICQLPRIRGFQGSSNSDVKTQK